MKARVIETGEIVNVTPYPTFYKEKGQGPDRREWDEDELEFISNRNSSKMVSLDEVCEWVKKHYAEYAHTRLGQEYLIEDLRKEFE